MHTPTMVDLPESLKTVPNIPWEKQTLAQLRAERDYWDSKVKEATAWGAGVSAAAEFRESCEKWIEAKVPPCERPVPEPSDHPRFPSGWCVECGAPPEGGCESELWPTWWAEENGVENDAHTNP